MPTLADTFRNIRGHQRIAGLIDVGSQMSVATRPDGRLLVVDAIALDDAQRDALLALTDGGARVDAVLHVHPFHTLHVEALHALLPDVPLHGTARHRRRFPALPWAGAAVETWGADAPFADTFEHSVPAGIDFECLDERVHVASVLLRHRASRSVHVDDTLNVIAAPGALGALLPQSALKMHPLLGRALQPRAGAADAYARWARGLASRWADTARVCAAHSAVREMPAGAFARELGEALAKVEGTLARHRRRYG